MTFKEGKAYDFQLEKTLDERVLLKKLKTAVEKGNKAVLETEVKNIRPFLQVRSAARRLPGSTKKGCRKIRLL